MQNNQSARDTVVSMINAEASYAETYCAKLLAGCPVTFVTASAVAFSPTPAAPSTVRTPSERELPPAVTHRATRGCLAYSADVPAALLVYHACNERLPGLLSTTGSTVGCRHHRADPSEREFPGGRVAAVEEAAP